MRRVFPFGWRYAHYVLSVLCIGCALLLIVLSLNGRTVWAASASASAGTATIRDAAGWDWLTRGAGAVTIIAICIGMYTSRHWLVIACTAIASVCLGWAASVAWHYSQDIAQGLVERVGWTVRTPDHVGTAAQVAALASAISLLLLVLNLLSRFVTTHRATTTR